MLISASWNFDTEAKILCFDIGYYIELRYRIFCLRYRSKYTSIWKHTERKNLLYWRFFLDIEAIQYRSDIVETFDIKVFPRYPSASISKILQFDIQKICQYQSFCAWISKVLWYWFLLALLVQPEGSELRLQDGYLFSEEFYFHVRPPRVSASKGKGGVKGSSPRAGKSAVAVAVLILLGSATTFFLTSYRTVCLHSLADQHTRRPQVLTFFLLVIIGLSFLSPAREKVHIVSNGFERECSG